MENLYHSPHLLEEMKKSIDCLTLDECKLLSNFLSERINLLSDLPYVETKIEELHFSVRAYNVLKNQGLHTIRNILEFGVSKLPALRNAGERTVKEINAAIQK